jgi:hypothetical protein
MAEGN